MEPNLNDVAVSTNFILPNSATTILLIGISITSFLLIVISLILTILFYLQLRKYIAEGFGNPRIEEIFQSILKIAETQKLIHNTFMEEMSRSRTEIITALNTTLNSLSKNQSDSLKIFSENIHQLTQLNSKHLGDINETLKNELQRVTLNINSTLKDMSQAQLEQLKIFDERLTNLTQLNSKLLSDINETLKVEIRHLQEKNEAKLEEMRKTVDEKLQTTLENRLSQSFKAVSEQLESVYKGLGEMKSLASDVGDLKRVLTNVKQRGIFGELQLENILEDILTPQQYEKNAKIKRDTTVEFAIKIPAKDDEAKYILLPIDSKFPREDYEKILSAQETGDLTLLKEAEKSLASRIKNESKDISEKYIDPPNTTDFAIMFLPVEGLFAEVLRIPGLFEEIRKEHNVIVTGPTTITAILNSLQMGFRTLAIEKKSQEVWKVLGAVKTEFRKFYDILNKTKEKLESAANEIEKVQMKTQIIDRKLKNVEQIDIEESNKLLALENELDSQE
ncbi:MAG: DNA recombination protein RmuC [Candidatus Hydrogenedentes bacterium]|nr:DNA recombination protein RmuC [Candidatus Hydrogenedentota bacterium]